MGRKLRKYIALLIMFSVFLGNITQFDITDAGTNKYTVVYYSNGGKGKMTSQKVKYGSIATLNTCTFYRKGYSFAGWSKSKKGDVNFTENAVVKDLVKKGKKIKLYAKWRKVGKRRALLLGETSSDQVPELDVESMELMMSKCKMYGQKISPIKSFPDQTKKKIIAEIQTFFIDTKKNDISYIYITCHGDEDGIISVGSDGEGFSTRELRNLLDNSIKGTVVLLLDYCYSGSAIDDEYTAEELIEDFTKIEGDDKSGELAASKYRVLCSSRNNETSKGGELSLATKYWELGCGWDGAGEVKTSLRADQDKNKKITLNELYEYSNEKVRKDSDEQQHIVAYPKGSDFVIFGNFN